jgi:protein-S-isoprenylcysteine O-methyltransferase Ste14
MYAGVLWCFAGVPLLLGSWYGLALAPVLIVLLGIRAVLEERTLRDKLEGYAEYAARVRYRFVPGIW